MKFQKSYAIPTMFALMLILGAIAPVAGAGEGITTNKSNIKANVPIKFDTTGLTAATYYTVYAETSNEGNKSTSATGTTLEFTVVIGDAYLDQWVTISLRDVTGVTTLASMELEVVAVVPQYTIDMIGAFIPLLMVFAVVFGLMSGIAILVLKLVR